MVPAPPSGHRTALVLIALAVAACGDGSSSAEDGFG